MLFCGSKTLSSLWYLVFCRGGVLQEVLYLICVRRLLHNSSRFVSDLQQLQPGVAAPPAGMLQPQAGLSEELMSAATRDAITAYLASTLGNDMQSTSPDTPLNIDRVQVRGVRVDDLVTQGDGRAWPLHEHLCNS
jgi:hypothetical protein